MRHIQAANTRFFQIEHPKCLQMQSESAIVSLTDRQPAL